MVATVEQAWGRNCTEDETCPNFCHKAGCKSTSGYAGQLAHNTGDDGHLRYYAVDNDGLTHLVLHPGHDHEITPENDGGCNGLPNCLMHPLEG
jgi:hypothetical protein